MAKFVLLTEHRELCGTVYEHLWKEFPEALGMEGCRNSDDVARVSGGDMATTYVGLTETGEYVGIAGLYHTGKDIEMYYPPGSLLVQLAVADNFKGKGYLE